MPDDFDVNDFDEARRNPRRYMCGLSKMIREGERGYHAALRIRMAGLLAMAYAGRDDYDLFYVWRQAECFEGNTKIHALTEDNFRPHVARCVVTLGCYRSDILPSTRSKTLTLIKALVAKDVKPEKCAEFIENKKGFEKAYQNAKDERARQKNQKTNSERSSRDEVPSGTKNKTAHKRASEAGGVRAVDDASHATQLWINLEDEELEDFSDSPEDGEIRLLKVLCEGKKGPTSPVVWSLMEYEVLEE